MTAKWGCRGGAGGGSNDSGAGGHASRQWVGGTVEPGAGGTPICACADRRHVRSVLNAGAAVERNLRFGVETVNAHGGVKLAGRRASA